MKRAKWINFVATVAFLMGATPLLAQQFEEIAPPRSRARIQPDTGSTEAQIPTQPRHPASVLNRRGPAFAGPQADGYSPEAESDVYLDPAQQDMSLNQPEVIVDGSYPAEMYSGEHIVGGDEGIMYDEHGQMMQVSDPYLSEPFAEDGGYCEECQKHGSRGALAFALGVEGVYIRPQFERNPAFTTVTSSTSSATFADSEFEYDYEITPRIWGAIQSGNGLGLRGSYWQFEHDAPTLTGTVPAGGSIILPQFGDFDVPFTNPGDVVSAATWLDTQAFDVDITMSGCIGGWDLLAGLGARYAEIEQGYQGEQRLANGAIEGTLNYSHKNKGIGPTLTLAIRRPIKEQLALFCAGRYSLLYGDATSSLTAVDSPYGGNPFTFYRNTDRNDLLPIGEIKIGLDWMSAESSMGRFFLRGAFEGQLWSGAGNASSESGDLGFFGGTIGGGVIY